MTYKVSEETLTNAYKPYDVVRFQDGVVGFISEVNVNTSQCTPEYQISYSIEFIGPNGGRHNAWYSHKELDVIDNLFRCIAKVSTNSCTDSRYWIEKTLF